MSAVDQVREALARPRSMGELREMTGLELPAIAGALDKLRADCFTSGSIAAGYKRRFALPDARPEAGSR